ncbi:MAG: hypothetical protein U0359_28595 [Byssovorax sp.]
MTAALKLPARMTAPVAEDDPVLLAVLTAPVVEGQPPAEEREAIRQAKAAGAWVKGAVVSAEIAARARRAR